MAAVISFPPLVFAIRGRGAAGATGVRFGGIWSDQDMYGEGLYTMEGNRELLEDRERENREIRNRRRRRR